MGNRAVITIKDDQCAKDLWPAIYLHWNGGMDSVKPLLSVCKDQVNTYGDSPVGVMRVVNDVIRKWLGRDELGTYGSFDTDNWDNGVYVIDHEFNIIDREFMDRPEQQEYPFNEVKAEIMSKL